MLGFKMPWTRRREERELAEQRANAQREQDREERRQFLRSTWLSQPRWSDSAHAGGAGWVEPGALHQQATPAALQGGGGSFDGGGASGDWPASASACSAASSAHSAHSHDSGYSSSDSGSSSDSDGSCGSD